MDKRKFLVGIIVTEIVSLLVFIVSFIITFRFSIGNILSNIGESFGINLVQEGESILVKVLFILETVSLGIFIISNIVRFFLISFKYKVCLVIGILSSYISYNLYLDEPTKWIYIVFLVLGLLLYLISHKIDYNYH